MPRTSRPATTRRDPPALAAPLLAWYRRSRRDLPWRRTRDPYAIWVSEVMLQQTRVETVKPYWERFLRRFPGVRELASAPLDDVLGQWSGLGYYRRARALHEAARAVVQRHAGELPTTVAELGELPGFGPYTAAAVASIAFGRDEPLVDGNVARVLSRLAGRDLSLPRDARELRALAADLLPPGEAGDFNQALMELGATVCTPGAPACLVCPVAEQCRARAEGTQRELPQPRLRRERPVLAVGALLVRRGASVLLARRPERGRFAGLWELPGREAARDPAHAARELSRELGLEAGDALGEVHQALTHRELVVLVVEARAPPGWRPRIVAPYLDVRFAPPADPPGGIASAARKALALEARGTPPVSGAPPSRAAPGLPRRGAAPAPRTPRTRAARAGRPR